jgi:hypothetical protein
MLLLALSRIVSRWSEVEAGLRQADDEDLLALPLCCG